MPEMTPEDERRSWSRAITWGIGFAIAMALLLVCVPFLVERLSPNWVGQDQGPTSQGLAGKTDKLALSSAKVAVKSDAKFGDYLVDDYGHPLYTYSRDTRGAGDVPPTSKCYEDCAKSWPPLLTAGTPAASSPAKKDLLTTIARKDGSRQVAYNGWPLYPFVRDVGSQQATGDNLADFSAKWHLLRPSGEELPPSSDTSG